MSGFNVTDTDSGVSADQSGVPVPPIVSAPGLPLGGMEHAKQVLAEYLQAELPAVCLSLRAVLGLPDPTAEADLLPVPAMFLNYEPPALDAKNLATSYTKGATSLCYVSCMRLGRLEMVEVGQSGDPDWWATYPMSVITWVKGNTWPDTIAASNNLITAVRACLLRKMGLNNPDELRLIPNSYTEQATEPEVMASGNRHARAAAANFQMRVHETMLIPPVGHVTAVDERLGMLTPFSTLPNPAVHPGPFTVG